MLGYLRYSRLPVRVRARAHARASACFRGTGLFYDRVSSPDYDDGQEEKKRRGGGTRALLERERERERERGGFLRGRKERPLAHIRNAPMAVIDNVFIRLVV
jgi:hypothetical protein